METVDRPKHNRGGRILSGLIVIGIGLVLLFKQMHLYIFPSWFFTWPMLLIVWGFFIGVRHGFRGWGGWLILMLVGGVFLVEDYFPQYSLSDYMWPVAIIIVGLFLTLRPRRRINWERMHYRHHQRHWRKWQAYENMFKADSGSDEDFIDSTTVFGEVDKVVVSKNFKGGDIVNIFGGCNINLAQADFTGTVSIDIVQIFGGAKIIVPTDWKIVVKATSVFGGVEDKRPASMIKENADKTLIIEGTSIFAGISIQCY